jgi:hypothetical protein
MSRLPISTERIAHSFAKLVARAKTRLAEGNGDGAAKYRPEAHYMRGPGPKWRAKHGQSSPSTAR